MGDLIWDVVVVGGGHAGCEAALAAARLGCRTLLLSMSLDTIAHMPCNPAIGGQAKGQMVREIDALGGGMARAIDRSGIQFQILNTRKGPAVQAPRAQADKVLYRQEMKKIVEEQEGLALLQEMVEDVRIEDGRAVGVVSKTGFVHRARSVILTTGTFLGGLVHRGLKNFGAGREGEAPVVGLSGNLARLGFEVGRLKTGTPPRLHGRTIDYAGMQEQWGDDPPQPFSFQTTEITLPQVACWITHTHEGTHDIIRANLDRSPMYTGAIQGRGPRYCPSIEDKVVRFADRNRHQVFLEPEGLNTHEVYCNGVSTSLPREAQDEIIRSIPGLERAQITRYGYAVEYDFFPPTQLYPTLETKPVEGLYFAGQINGTSGYEEAGGQGLMAGINAGLKVLGQEPLILDRSEAYIGVLIDDLVTSGTQEPYRMFSSRAEYRLLLRHDNADRRLLHHAERCRLIPAERARRIREKDQRIQAGVERLKGKRVGQDSVARILRRPENSFADIREMVPELDELDLSAEEERQVELEVKYEGYIRRQQAQVDKFKRLEEKHIPSDFNYAGIAEMRRESREKLATVKPRSLGQASRISGVTPADISLLMVALKRRP